MSDSECIQPTMTDLVMKPVLIKLMIHSLFLQDFGKKMLQPNSNVTEHPNFS